jgi:hypothetical protein
VMVAELVPGVVPQRTMLFNGGGFERFQGEWRCTGRWRGRGVLSHGVRSA